MAAQRSCPDRPGSPHKRIGVVGRGTQQFQLGITAAGKRVTTNFRHKRDGIVTDEQGQELEIEAEVEAQVLDGTAEVPVEPPAEEGEEAVDEVVVLRQELEKGMGHQRHQ